MRLYHYTTISGLIGIATTKTLWASHCKGMNDIAEGVYLGKYARAKYERRLLGCDVSIEEIIKFMDLYDHVMRHLDYYLISFSRNGDLLDQWRCYGDNGRGCSLGFDVPDSLISNVPPYQLANQDLPVVFSECLYQHERMDGIIQDVLMREYPGQDRYFAFSMAANEIARHGLLCKHPSFINEREVRMLYRPARVARPDGGVEYAGQLGNARWRTCKYGLVSYFEYPIPVDWIKEVVIGPGLDGSHEVSMHCMLEDFGLRANVVRSVCPHR